MLNKSSQDLLELFANGSGSDFGANGVSNKNPFTIGRSGAGAPSFQAHCWRVRVHDMDLTEAYSLPCPSIEIAQIAFCAP